MSLEAGIADAVRALGWTLIHSLWQGALVAAAYALFRLLARGRDVRVRYAGGLAAMLLMLALPTATLLASLAGTDAAPALAVPGDGAPVAPPWAARIEAWLPLLVLAWGLGVLASGVREAWRFRAMRTLLLGGAVDLDEWTARSARIARQLRVSRPVRVVSSALARTPSLVGWLRPVVVLPASAVLALSPRQLEMVIAHELAHVSRGDYVVNLLQVAAETLLFHHPAVHWISREVRGLREACCDDLVLRSGVDPLHYADTLASLEELRGFTHAPALAATGGSLLLRVRRIVGVGAEASSRMDGQMVVLCAGLFALAALLAGHQAASDATVGPPPPTAVLARSAVAAVASSVAPAMRPATPRPAPTAPPARRAAPKASAAPAAGQDVASKATVSARPAAPAPPIALAPDAATPGAAPAVDDLRTRRQVIRPVIVLADGAPNGCIRSLGSRLCRALPESAVVEAAVVDGITPGWARSAAHNGQQGARAPDAFGR